MISLERKEVGRGEEKTKQKIGEKIIKETVKDKFPVEQKNVS